MINVDKIELWKAKESIAVERVIYNDTEIKRKVLIEKGEIVEFRYHHSIHFRTIDDIYCVLDEETFYRNFEPYGKIYDSVHFANHCELKDIIEHRLFEKWEHIKHYDKFKKEVMGE